MRAGALPYYGGKNPSRGLTAWIASRLPWERGSLYLEPFCGMAGVLLSRKPVKCEIVNDLNDRLANWWRTVRDRPEEFGRALDGTHQHCRSEFERSLTLLDNSDPVVRAVAYTVVLCGSVVNSDAPGKTQFGTRYTLDAGIKPSFTSRDVERIHERTREVQIENRDAIRILERVAGEPAATVYVDPPYETADTSAYRFGIERAALRAALLAQEGKVAVSGYGEEWSDLGWRSESYSTSANAGRGSGKRVERLWMNYGESEGDLFK